jgi:glycosyltransferase involved in cell wall biosynthesis
MHIVLTRRDYPLEIPDGINVFIFALADALMRSGHEVSVVSAAASDPAAIRGYFHLDQLPQILSLTNRKDLGYISLPFVWATSGRRMMRRLRPDLTIVNGVIPIRMPGRVSLAVCHDMERRRGPKFLPDMRRVYRSLGYRRHDGIVATCHEVRGALAEELQVRRASISVIPTCIDRSSYAAKSVRDRTNAVLHMGTQDYKNPLASVRAITRLADPTAKLLITGAPSASLDSFLATLAPAVANRIEQLGYVSESELRDLLATVRAVAVPSTYWTPVASPTVLEALAAGTPVIGSPSISTDLLKNEVNGYRFDPEDETTFADALSTLLDDDDRWEAMSTAALLAAETFDAETVAEAYIQLGRSLGPSELG